MPAQRKLHRPQPARSVPAGYLASAIELAIEYGYDMDGVLERFDLPESAMRDTGMSISELKFYPAMNWILRQINVPGFGLLHGQRIKPASYGVLWPACLSSDTVESALALAVEFQELLSAPNTYYFEQRADHGAIIAVDNHRTNLRRWAVECHFAVWATVIEAWLGEPGRYRELHLAIADAGYAGLYQKIFRCPIHFEQPRNELRIPNEVLTKHLANTNSSVRQACVEHCHNLLNDDVTPGRAWVRKIESVILSSIPITTQRKVVARRLTLSPRTMQRRLKAEGTNYKATLEDVRKRLASEYLAETSMQPKRIAYELGYSDPTNFYHAFRRWYNCTPQQYRRS